MSTVQALTIVLAAPMQIIFFIWSIVLAFKTKYAEAAFTMSLSIMMLLMVRLP
jgi:hypothetical protein